MRQSTIGTIGLSIDESVESDFNTSSIQQSGNASLVENNNVEETTSLTNNSNALLGIAGLSGLGVALSNSVNGSNTPPYECFDVSVESDLMASISSYPSNGSETGINNSTGKFLKCYVIIYQIKKNVL